MDVSRVYLLASDHRWQWEAWCDATAIGRTVFWGPGTAYLTGKIPAADAIEAMASTYLSLVDQWIASSP